MIMFYRTSEVLDEVLKKTHRKNITPADLEYVMERKLGLKRENHELYSKSEKEALVLYFLLNGAQKRLTKARHKMDLMRLENKYLKDQTKAAEDRLISEKYDVGKNITKILKILGEEASDSKWKRSTDHSFMVEPQEEDEDKNNHQQSKYDLWSMLPPYLKPQNLDKDEDNK